METLRPGRTRRMRWLSLVAAPLIALVVAARVAGLTTGGRALKARG
jgi:hypothetical protein